MSSATWRSKSSSVTVGARVEPIWARTRLETTEESEDLDIVHEWWPLMSRVEWQWTSSATKPCMPVFVLWRTGPIRDNLQRQ